MSSIAVVAGEASGDIHAGNLVAALRWLRPDLQDLGRGGRGLGPGGCRDRVPQRGDRRHGAGGVRWATCPHSCGPGAGGERFAARPAGPVRAGGFRRVQPVAVLLPPTAPAFPPCTTSPRRCGPGASGGCANCARGWTGPWSSCRSRSRSTGATGSTPSTWAPPCWITWPRGRRQPEPDVVGLLPGSRPGEVTRILPLLVEVARRLAAERPLRFLVPCAPGLPVELLSGPLDAAGLSVEILDGDAQQVMERSRVCVMASGTATLECALVGTPMVSVYQVSVSPTPWGACW